MNVDITVDLVFILISFYLAFISIKQWIRISINHESVFFWGLSCLLICMVYIINLISYFHMIKGMNIVIHTFDTLILIFQMYSIMLSLCNCDMKHDCSICKKKFIRLLMWLLILPVLFIIPIQMANNPSITIQMFGLRSLQTLGVRSLDIGIEILHAVLALIIFLIIPKSQNLNYLKISFGFMFVSELTQVVNIMLFECGNSSLFEIEWGLAVVSISLLFYAVYNIVKEK